MNNWGKGANKDASAHSQLSEEGSDDRPVIFWNLVLQKGPQFVEGDDAKNNQDQKLAGSLGVFSETSNSLLTPRRDSAGTTRQTKLCGVSAGVPTTYGEKLTSYAHLAES